MAGISAKENAFLNCMQSKGWLKVVEEDTTKKQKSDDFFQWAEKQHPALKFAAMESDNPDDIIWAISEYKKFKQTGGNPKE